MIFFYVLAFFFLLFFLIIFLSIRSEKKRSKNLKDFALRNGFSYIEGHKKLSFHLIQPDDKTAVQTNAFQLFNLGYRKTLSNLMKGNKGRKIIIFDYSYTVPGGKQSHTYTQTVFLAKVKRKLPQFTLSKENIFHKIGNVFGYKDIDFNTNLEFSKKYLLKGKEESRIRNLFNIEVLKYFEKKDAGFVLDAYQDTIVYYRPARRIRSDLLDQKLREFLEIVQIFDR